MRYETKGINEMPKWMYWVLAVAFAWLIWTNFLKPVPDLDQLKTQQNVQIIELESRCVYACACERASILVVILKKF